MKKLTGFFSLAANCFKLRVYCLFGKSECFRANTCRIEILTDIAALQK